MVKQKENIKAGGRVNITLIRFAKHLNDFGGMKQGCQDMSILIFMLWIQGSTHIGDPKALIIISG